MWLRVVKKNCRTTILHLQEADASGFIRFDGFWFASKGAAAKQGKWRARVEAKQR